MADWQILVFLVLMLGVGLGSAAAALATWPSKQERQWLALGKAYSDPQPTGRLTTQSLVGEPPE